VRTRPYWTAAAVAGEGAESPHQPITLQLTKYQPPVQKQRKRTVVQHRVLETVLLCGIQTS